MHQVGVQFMHKVIDFLAISPLKYSTFTSRIEWFFAINRGTSRNDRQLRKLFKCNLLPIQRENWCKMHLSIKIMFSNSEILTLTFKMHVAQSFGVLIIPYMRKISIKFLSLHICLLVGWKFWSYFINDYFIFKS